MKMKYAIYAAIAVIAFLGFRYLGTEEQSAPTEGAAMISVTVPELVASEKLGERLFNGNCAACHGKNAAGIEGTAPPLIHRIYEPGHHGDEAFQIAAKRGVRAHHWKFGNMPPVDGISRDDVAKIIKYVRAVQRANGI